MKNKTYLSISVLLLLASFSLFLLYSTSASAQRILPDARAVTDCYNSKLKASGKYVNCLLRAERQANRNQVEVSDEDVAHCHENFEDRFMRAEANAAGQGAECPSHGGLVGYQQTVVDSALTIDLNNDLKTLDIEIQDSDLEYLMSRSLNLNIAIKVNGEFNVIWRAIPSSDLTAQMGFQWSPVYQVYGAESPEEFEKVDIETNVNNISLGHDVVLGSTLGSSGAGNNPNGVNFLNNSGGTINAALAQQISLLGSNNPTTTSIFISDVLLDEESILLTPSEEVLVWFGKNTKTGEVFFHQPTDFDITLNFSTVKEFTIKFENMDWDSPLIIQ